ncbi:cytosolic nonspecific dipeptidase [Anaerolineae bacterium]|nr:cytosolic nonspecific dipeptidase [Anaerolineae bacterium]
MSDPFSYLDSMRGAFINELKELIQIESISTLSAKAGEVRRAAELVAQHLRGAGMSTVQIFETPRHPVVYGEWLGAPGAPTILIYGHYDVQPVDDPEKKWLTDPFTPVEREGNLYGRGSSDDKGQIFANIKAAQALAQNGGLPLNIKFLVEGEEEIGSPNLDHFIESHQELLRADVAVISDTAVLSLETPSIIYALRGLTYLEIEVSGPEKDLHSGQWGGSVHNPLQSLCEIIAALHNPDGSINVEGFYDKVRPISAEERAAIAKVPLTESEWKRQTGAPQPWGEPSYSLRERVSARPTLEVHGLIGGFSGEGAKTVLPAHAKAKVSCRLVNDQDPHEIEHLIRRQVEKLTPPTVRSKVTPINYGDPAVVPIDSAAIKAAVDAYQRGWGTEPVFMREGGSIPVVATFSRMFHIPVLLVGYGLSDDGAHGPNEKFNLECFYRGMRTMIALLQNLGKMTPAQVKG